jgi:hypothetical protein
VAVFVDPLIARITHTHFQTSKRIAREEHDDSLDQSSLYVDRMFRVVMGVEEALRSDYYFIPTLEELRERFVNGSVKIGDSGLTIGRLRYGEC